MKNLGIYLAGIFSTNLLMLGCLCKIMHWPGAGIMLVCAVTFFSFIFLPLSLIKSYNSQQERKYMMLHIITFIVFSFGMLTILFSAMHYEGNSLMKKISLLLPFVLFLPVYLYQTRNEKKSNTEFLAILFGLAFIAVFSVLMTLHSTPEIISV